MRLHNAAKWEWMPVFASLVSMAGCGGLEPVTTHEAVTDPAALYMELTLEHRAINLAITPPYHTVQLVATPRDARGEAMANLPAPTFRLATPGDSTRLRVTPDGVVTALAVGSQISVIAELATPGPVRHADSARITVTATPTMLGNLSIEPTSPENAIWSLGSTQQSLPMLIIGVIPQPQLTVQVLDPTGQSIAGLAIEYTSLDPDTAAILRWDPSNVILRRPGHARMVARTLAYGVSKADTALYTVSWPMEGVVDIGLNPGEVFQPAEVRIRPQGFIAWRNALGDSADVVFDDPTNVARPIDPLCEFLAAVGFPDVCGAGDMLIPKLPDPSPSLDISNWQYRQFPVPGTYTYHSSRTGGVGRIVVTDEVSTGAEP